LLRPDAPVVGVHVLGRTAAFVLGEEEVLLASESKGETRVAAHSGGILSSASDGTTLVTGGDDGKVMLIDATGGVSPVATDERRRWIDCVACGPDGAMAWSAGKTVFMRPAKGEVRTLDVASTVGGLAFAPKGLRLAVSHYNGVSLWFPKVQAAPEHLEWKGSHHEVAFSPDGRFLVTSMQEPTLHGWRVADGKHMRMSGYSARVRSFGWTASGKWLATAGSEQLVMWPFQAKDGPMGKTPEMRAAFAVRATVVAPHPKQEIVAVGYADGTILLVRVDDGAEVVAKHPGASSVTAIGWDGAGVVLAWGTEDGHAGMVDLG